MHIVDISEHNGAVNFDKLKEKADGVMIRLSLGFRENGTVYRVDNKAMHNIKECERVGLPWGVYHYSYAPHTEGAKLEALGVIKLLSSLKEEGYKPLLPIAFDMEDNHDLPNGDHNGASFSECRDMCQVFVDALKANGYTPMVYASRFWFQQMGEIKNCQKWVAEWGVSKPSIPCELWQHSVEGDGYAYGTQKPVIDLNTAFVDYVPKVKECKELPSTLFDKVSSILAKPSKQEKASITVTIGEMKWEFTPQGELIKGEKK